MSLGCARDDKTERARKADPSHRSQKSRERVRDDNVGWGGFMSELKLRPPKAEEKSGSLGCARDDKAKMWPAGLDAPFEAQDILKRTPTVENPKVPKPT